MHYVVEDTRADSWQGGEARWGRRAVHAMPEDTDGQDAQGAFRLGDDGFAAGWHDEVVRLYVR